MISMVLCPSIIFIDITIRLRTSKYKEFIQCFVQKDELQPRTLAVVPFQNSSAMPFKELRRPADKLQLCSITFLRPWSQASDHANRSSRRTWHCDTRSKFSNAIVADLAFDGETGRFGTSSAACGPTGAMHSTSSNQIRSSAGTDRASASTGDGKAATGGTGGLGSPRRSGT